MKLTDWLPTVIAWLVPLGFSLAWFAGRTSIKAWIDNRIALQRDKKLEEFREELRAERELISALRDSVLSGQANRQALLDQQRIEAVMEVWKAVNEIGAQSGAVMTLQVIKLEEVGKRISSDPQLQRFFSILAKTNNAWEPVDRSADRYEPFISPLAWALFSTYAQIVSVAQAILLALAGGHDPNDFFRLQGLADVTKKVLPEMSEGIDQWGPSAAFSLLPNIRSKLLDELRSTLEGKEADRGQLEQAREISKQLDRLSKAENEQKLAQAGEIPKELQRKDPTL